MKKFLAILLSAAVLCAVLLPVAVSAKITTTGQYAPLWSKELYTQQKLTEPLWKPFYLNKETNTVKFDLIQGSGGEKYAWKIPGEQYAVVWEGFNVVAPSDNSDVGYLFTSGEDGKVEFHMVGKLDTPNATDVEIAVYKNNFTAKVYPADSACILAKKGQEISIDFTVDLKKNDKIFFKFHSPVEVADSPQFRFSTDNGFYAMYRTLGSAGQSAAGTSSSKTGAQSAAGASSVNSQNDSSQAAGGQSQPQGGGVIIEDPDTPAISSKYEDITVDLDNNVIKMTKKLSVKDFMESFTLKDGHTIKLYRNDGSLVNDNSLTVTSEMVAKLYNQSTPINVFKLETAFSADGDTKETSGGDNNSLLIVILAAAAVLIIGGGAAFYFLKLRKKA